MEDGAVGDGQADDDGADDGDGSESEQEDGPEHKSKKTKFVAEKNEGLPPSSFVPLQEDLYVRKKSKSGVWKLFRRHRAYPDAAYCTKCRKVTTALWFDPYSHWFIVM